MHTTTEHSPMGLHRRALLWQACAALALGGLAWGMSRPAHAAPSATVVEAVQLPAWVERNGQRRPAEPGAQLRAKDRAITATGSRMLLRMDDRSVIKLGEQTEFLIQSLDTGRESAAAPSQQKSSLKLISGVFRYATDYTSKALGNKRELNIELATATVGIRGTDFWSMTDAAHDAVCVFEGKVEVVRDAKPGIELDKPGAFWVVFTGAPEKPAGQATPDQLAKFIGQAEMQPGKGIVLQGGRWRTVAGFVPSGAQANALRARLQTAGYPAEVVAKDGRFEVRINQLATREDAEAVLKQLQTNTALGVTDGRVALATR
ncbi:FecR domain-containing protein [Hydrogenophaga sp.]|uniref:FecR domain-containing protein n=1 Tax=Hydrogenophaga sp. TaxID=1904254 RepID=UPI0025BD367C|nr:FecR domain-containing protein [Hydrogenophaga sp.]MBT9466335.1 FecR domain-containing protein [Hydrogenophaga sp.]